MVDFPERFFVERRDLFSGAEGGEQRVAAGVTGKEADVAICHATHWQNHIGRDFVEQSCQSRREPVRLEEPLLEEVQCDREFFRILIEHAASPEDDQVNVDTQRREPLRDGQGLPLGPAVAEMVL